MGSLWPYRSNLTKQPFCLACSHLSIYSFILEHYVELCQLSRRTHVMISVEVALL